jgi:hypothetical protein
MVEIASVLQGLTVCVPLPYSIFTLGDGVTRVTLQRITTALSPTQQLYMQPCITRAQQLSLYKLSVGGREQENSRIFRTMETCDCV